MLDYSVGRRDRSTRRSCPRRPPEGNDADGRGYYSRDGRHDWWGVETSRHLDCGVAIAMDPFLPTAMLDWHHLACIAREAWTMEAVTIVGSRQAKSVEHHENGSC